MTSEIPQNNGIYNILNKYRNSVLSSDVVKDDYTFVSYLISSGCADKEDIDVLKNVQKQLENKQSKETNIFSFFENNSNVDVDEFSFQSVMNASFSSEAKVKHIDKEKEVKTNFITKFIKSDGKIGDFAQSPFIGDCGLLSTLKALSVVPEGAKCIKNAISKDPVSGNLMVHFAGAGRTYKISDTELYGAVVSVGDVDVRAIELAANKYIKERSNEVSSGAGPDIVDKYYQIKSNDNIVYSAIWAFEPETLVYLLTGSCKSETVYDLNEPLVLEYQKNPKRYAGTVEFSEKDKKESKIPNWLTSVYDVLKNQVRGLCGGAVEAHSFSLLDMNKDGLKVANPWLSRVDIKFNNKDLEKYRYTVHLFDTKEFLDKPAEIKTENGSEILYKKLNGKLFRKEEKDENNNIKRIIEYCDDGERISKVQEYKNGQKYKLLSYWTEEGLSDDEKDVSVVGTDYFKDNKLIKSLCKYSNGNMFASSYDENGETAKSYLKKNNYQIEITDYTTNELTIVSKGLQSEVYKFNEENDEYEFIRNDAVTFEETMMVFAEVQE